MRQNTFLNSLKAAICLAMAQSASVLVAATTEPVPFIHDSLESYLQRAFAANPDLKAFEHRYEAALQRVPQATALPDPMIQVTHFAESVQTRTGPQENVFMLSQKLPWFGTLKRLENAASLEAEALWFAFQNRQLTLARELAMAYYEYGYTGEAIRLTKANLDLLKKLEPIVESKVEAGADLNALLRLKVELGTVDDRLHILKQKRFEQSAKLGEFLAISKPSPIPHPIWGAPDLFSPDADSIRAAILTQNPELQMLQRKVASAEARSELARLERYPDFTLGINYIQTGNPKVNPNTPDAGQDPWGVTLAVNIPIWSGRYTAAEAEAFANERALEGEYNSRFNAIKAEVSTSLAKLKDANRRLKLYGEELLDLAQQAVENTRASYQNGRAGILELIDSERSLLDLQLLYWRAAADAWQQRVVLQSLANQPIGGISTTSQDHE